MLKMTILGSDKWNQLPLKSINNCYIINQLKKKAPFNKQDTTFFSTSIYSNCSYQTSTVDPSIHLSLFSSDISDIPTLLNEITQGGALPIGSICMPYMVTFTINKKTQCQHIYHTWILWAIVSVQLVYKQFNYMVYGSYIYS